MDLNTSHPALLKLTHKQKLLTYQIAKWEYRIYTGFLKMQEVDTKIENVKNNIHSLIAAIKAAGEGQISQKLSAWKVKAEYRLFKLQLRKNKIDVPKLIIIQSQLEQVKKAIEIVNETIRVIENPPIETVITSYNNEQLINKIVWGVKLTPLIVQMEKQPPNCINNREEEIWKAAS